MSKVLALHLIILVALLTACSGGSSDSDGGPPVVVSLSPGNTAAVYASTSQQFAASVENDPNNRGVTWSLKGTGCNRSPCGTLTDVTTNSVTYTAPPHVPSPDTETLIATAVADGKASASAAITITALPVIHINVSPESATIALGDTARFSAEVVDDPIDQGVTWSIAGCPTGLDCGSISPASTPSYEPAYYTAPASVPHNTQVTMTATSITDPTRFATAELTISTTAQPISVSVSPTTVSVPIGAFVPLTATVNNDSTGAGVTWAVAGCTSEPCGALANVQTTSATYSAPQSPSTAQVGNQVTITATSINNPNQSASSTITLTRGSNCLLRKQPSGRKVIPTRSRWGISMPTTSWTWRWLTKGIPETGDNGDVSILLGGGDGTFQAARSFAAGKNPIWVAMGDFNGDGKPDLIVSDLGERPAGGKGDVNVLLGAGDGSFQAPTSFAAGDLPFTLAMGDFNGDSRLDAAASDFGSGTSGGINLLLGDGKGAFAAPGVSRRRRETCWSRRS